MNQEKIDLVGVKKTVTEAELIMNRFKFMNIVVDPDKPICPHHRYTFGIHWHHGNVCQYPEHTGSRKPRNRISWKSYSKIITKYQDFPILGGLCEGCVKLVNAEEDQDLVPLAPVQDPVQIETTQSSTVAPIRFPSDQSGATLTTQGSSTSQTSGSAFEVPKSYDVPDHVRKEKKVILDKMCSLLNINPPLYQLIKNIEDDKQNLSRFKRTFESLQTALVNLFCEAIAPGQESELKEYLSKKNYDDLDEKDKAELQLYLQHYEACTTSAAQLAVLTMIPKKFKKETISNLFGVSYYHIKLARRRHTQYGPITEPPKVPITRQRLDLEKIQHFLSFLTESSLLQEEAYGTTTIKYDSGEKRVVSNSLLMCLKEEVIKEYKARYNTYSSSTLRKILDSIKPKTRRRLAGVDSFLVHGYEAFEVLSYDFSHSILVSCHVID